MDQDVLRPQFALLPGGEVAVEHRIRLHDGRMLGYAEFGDSTGFPLLYFHGFPGSRLEARLTVPVAAQLGARIIAIDRPGIGLSDPHPKRTIADWPYDVAQLADALHIDRFAVLGVSGGTPYTLSCAATLRDRVASVGIVCGMGPTDQRDTTDSMRSFDRRVLRLAGTSPRLIAPFLSFVAWYARRDPLRAFRLIAASACGLDADTMGRDDVTEIMSMSIREWSRNGSEGTRDLYLFAHPWNISLENISARIHLWHGERDETVPVSMGRYHARTLPNCDATFMAEEGHFSLPINHMEEIIGRIVQSARERCIE